MSDNGRILAIGTPQFVGGAGISRVEVYKFIKKGKTPRWKQFGDVILGGANGDNTGIAVALSSDGKILAVGTQNFNGNNGNVKVYSFDVDMKMWVQMGEPISPTGADFGDYFGATVKLSGDGTVVAIGATPRVDFTRKGFTEVHRFEDGKWSLMGNPLTGIHQRSGRFGEVIGLSETGLTMVIGDSMPPDQSLGDPGYIQVFSFNESGNSWEVILTANGEGDERFGFSVAMSDSGDVIAVAAPNKDCPLPSRLEDCGEVKVYRVGVSGEVGLNPIGQPIAGTSENEIMGAAIDISNDGAVVSVASNRDVAGQFIGVITVYRFNDTSDLWEVDGDAIEGPPVTKGGLEVALSGDGESTAFSFPGPTQNGELVRTVQAFKRITMEEPSFPPSNAPSSSGKGGKGGKSKKGKKSGKTKKGKKSKNSGKSSKSKKSKKTKSPTECVDDRIFKFTTANGERRCGFINNVKRRDRFCDVVENSNNIGDRCKAACENC